VARRAQAPPPAGRPGRSLLVERELIHSLEWLISLRWFAGIVVLLVTPLSAAILQAQMPVAKLAFTGFAILGYNVVLWFSLRRLRRTDPENTVRFERFARLQIALDWITMAVLISLSGGAESPAIIFFLFHIAIASLLLPHDLGLLYVSLAPALVIGVAALEYFGLLPHVAIIQPARYHDPLFVLASLVFFASACYGMAYCCMAIALRLRRRETELGSLYDGVRDITSTLEIDTVLDRIVEATARVLCCRAAAIRLIDPARAQVEFAASFGLSEAYRDEVPAEFARSRLDQDTLREGMVHVLDVEKDPRVWRGERVRDEGISSMLSAAIHGRTGAMGVLRAYGAPGHRFSDEDLAYLRAVAAQGAVAIEHAKAYLLLADLDRDKSRFLRMTTHELRSPVRVTESLLMTLADGYAGKLEPEQGELVRRAQRRLASLHALIDDLLDLAAGKAMMVAPHLRVLDLRMVVTEVVERFQAVAQEKHVVLVLESTPDPLDVFCDPADLERIVVNLVSNAVKYTPQGSVTVALSGGAEHVRLSVADTGIGIPLDALPHLFSEFYRASNAKAVEESGTGLGLSIVKLLVDRAGGRITVESREGEGSTFSLEMARADAAGAADSLA
jgi:signal transduction histidine kinase